MFDIAPQELASSLAIWGYSIMLILMIVEGPITTLTAAFLASIGLFNVFIVYGLSVFGDIFGDIILYWIGRSGGRPIAKKTEKLMKLKDSTIKKIEDRFEKSGAKIIFYVKATTGLAFITFILAGTVKMNFKKFLQFSFLGGVVWSGTLVILGYFFGYAAVQIEKYIKFAGWVIFAIALATFFYLISASKRKSFGKFLSGLNNNKK